MVLAQTQVEALSSPAFVNDFAAESGAPVTGSSVLQVSGETVGGKSGGLALYIILIIAGGSVLVVSIAAFVIYKFTCGKGDDFVPRSAPTKASSVNDWAGSGKDSQPRKAGSEAKAVQMQKVSRRSRVRRVNKDTDSGDVASTVNPLQAARTQHKPTSARRSGAPKNKIESKQSEGQSKQSKSKKSEGRSKKK